MAMDMAEYVVKLSTQLDNKGMTQIIDFLSSGKMKALGLTAALSAATTAVYKFVESTVQRNQQIEETAKKQKKSIEQTRAETEALNAMGKTLNEIKKDAALKSIYKDIVATNKALEMPNASAAMEKIKALQASFWKLKSVVNMMVQAIGNQLITNLVGPIDSITKKLDKITNWFRKNFITVTTKITSYLTAFSKGILTIGKTISGVFAFFKQLPSTIQSSVLAIGSLWAIIKSGPIGQLLAIVTAIGDIKHDYDVYQWNKLNRESAKTDKSKKGDKTANKTVYVDDNGNQTDINTGTPFQQGVAFDFAWDIWSGEGDTGEKIGKIVTAVMLKATEAMDKAWASSEGQSAIGTIFKGQDGKSGLLGGIVSWFGDADNLKALEGFGESFLRYITEAIKDVGGLFGGAIGGVVEAIFGDGIVSDEIFNDESAGTTFATTIGTFFHGFFEKIKTGGKFHEAFLQGLGEGGLGALISSFISSINWDSAEFDVDDPLAEHLALKTGKTGKKHINWDKTFEGMGGSLKAVGETFKNFIVRAIQTIDNLSSIVFTEIGRLLKEASGGNEDSVLQPLAGAFETLGDKDGILGKAIGRGIALAATTGNGMIGFVGSIVETISGALKEPEKFENELKELGNSLGEFIGIIWEGAWVDPKDHSKGRKGGMLKEFIFGKEEDGEIKGGIVNKIKEAFEGQDGQGGLKGLFDKLAAKVSVWLEPLGNSISNFFKGLWARIYNEGPEWLRQALGFVGINDPNSTTVKKDEKNGKFTAESTTGEKQVVSEEQAKFIEEHGGNIALGKDGWYFTGEQYGYGNESRGSGTNNQLLNWWMSGGSKTGQPGYFGWEKYTPWKNGPWKTKTVETPKPDGTGLGINQVKEETKTDVDKILSKGERDLNMKVYGVPIKPSGSGAESSASTTASQESASAAKESTTQVKVLGDASNKSGKGVQQLGKVAEMSSKSFSSIPASLVVFVAALRNFAAKVNSIKLSLGPKENALGGRFASEMNNMTVAEDGTEYIIPITKPSRAMPLIYQMLSEMGSGAIESVLGKFGASSMSGLMTGISGKMSADMGLGSAGTLGQSLSGLQTAMQGMQQSINYNISAPVSIYVNSSGTNAEQIGASAYSAAERYLVKNLRGAWA